MTTFALVVMTALAWFLIGVFAGGMVIQRAWDKEKRKNQK